MMQRLTSKRLGRRAYFRSLLMLGLVAGSSCAPFADLAAQSPSEPAHLPRQAQLPPLAELPGAPPSLHGIEHVGQPLPKVAGKRGVLPQAPEMLAAALPCTGSPQAVVRAPRHVVQLLGLKPGSTTSTSRFMTLATPSHFDARQVPELKQVQFVSSLDASRQSCVPASDTNSDSSAGVVTHAYLAQPGAASLQRVGQAPVRPLSSAPVAKEHAVAEARQYDVSPAEHTASDKKTTSTSATGKNAPEDDVPVVSGPVKYDPAAAGAAPDAAAVMPAEESESLLDVDLSALTAQGPLAAPGASATAQRPATVSIIEEAPTKLIGTERGSLSQSRPITRAPQLSLSDDASADEPEKSAPVKAHLAATIVRPTRVKIHETFSPRDAGAAQSFHLSDTQTPSSTETASPFKLASQYKLVDQDEPAEGRQAADETSVADEGTLRKSTEPILAAEPPVASEPSQARKLPGATQLLEEPPLLGARLPAEQRQATLPQTPALLESPALVESPKLAESPKLVEDTQAADEPKRLDKQFASAPELLPAAPALSGVPAPAIKATKPEAGAALVVPFVPGTEGLVTKASRPGLEQPAPHPSDATASPTNPLATNKPAANQPAASLLDSKTAEIASSSSQRPISLRIGAEAMVAASTPSSTTEQRALSDRNPIALAGPVVRPVKQMKPDPFARQVAATMPAAQPTEATASKQSLLVQELMATIKKTFPSSRVELKADEEEEGLVAEGVAASESEAKKILAMVRKTALCPVADRIITTR